MAEESIRNKFVSWTLNVVKPKQSFYGVGINLALVSSSSGTTSTSGGVTSATTTSKHNRVGVDSVEPNGPAAKAGLQAGDIIVKVDGETFHDGKVYLPDDVASVIRGAEGSTVDVIVERDGENVEFTITREPIGVVPSSPPTTPPRKNGDKEKMTIEKKKKETAANEPQKKAATVSDSINSLSLSEEEHKEKDLSESVLEGTDKFDDDIPPSACCNILPILQRCNSSELRNRCNSNDDVSEEKTAENNEEISSICNSAGGDSAQWELISERSGSAVVISFSGSMSGASFRSASPSVLKNKFVLEESTGEAYINHVVLPTDTLQGLCLAYKCSATRLRMENNFSGNSLQMAPKKLKIPTKAAKGMMIRVQDRTSKEFKLYAFVAELPTMELVEAKAYLDLSSWDLEDAIRSAREDDGFGFEPSTMETSPVLSAVTKPKTLTAQDIYAAPPPFDGHGFELKDIAKH